jgi:hypothetical protein
VGLGPDVLLIIFFHIAAFGLVDFFSFNFLTLTHVCTPAIDGSTYGFGPVLH